MAIVNYSPVRNVSYLSSVFALFCLVALPILVNVLGFSSYLSSDPLYIISGLYSETSSSLLPGLPGWIDPNSGVTSQALGSLAAAFWLSGHLPWWDHYSGIGMPLGAAMQSHSLFFPFVLLLHFANGPLLLKISLQIVAGLAMHALLRRIGLRELATFVGAVVFQLNGTFAWFSDAPMTPIAFLPLFILGIEHAFDRRKTASRGWLLISVAVAFSLYAGFPETAYMNGLLALTWAGVRLAISPSDRLGAIVRVAAGGMIGLLLSAPLLTAFVRLLMESDLTQRADMTARGLNANSFVAMLFPYFSGPISTFEQYSGSSQVVDMWSNIGGYLPLGLIVAAIFGSVNRPYRWMRFTLLGWLACALLLVFWILPAFNPIAHMPGMRLLAFYRYAWPSMAFCATILAALFVDDLLRHSSRNHVVDFLPGLLWLSLTVLLGGGSLLLIRDQLTFFLSTGFRETFFLTTFFGVVAASLAPSFSFFVPITNRSRALVAASMLAFSSIALFLVPIFSGKSVLEKTPESVTFLQRNLGFHRFYTFGPFAPNYGAYFRLSSINNVYNPVPQRWVAYVKSKLDPAAVPRNFLGNWPPQGLNGETRAGAFLRNVHNFEKAGVKFVIAPLGLNPFSAFSPPSGSPTSPQVIAVNASFTDSVVVPPKTHGVVRSFSIYVGTFSGQADGLLALDLCIQDNCSKGRLAAKDVVDNSMATFVLDHGLDLITDERLTFSITQSGGTHPVAVWKWMDGPKSQKDSLLSLESHAAISLDFNDDRYRKVFQDSSASIYELADPSPYFENADHACRFEVKSRDAVDLTCSSASTVIRREMFYPGWEVKLNGSQAAIKEFDGIFQAIDVPQGRSELRFSYAPPYIGLAFILFGSGVLLFGSCVIWPTLMRSRHARSALIVTRTVQP